MWDSFGANRLEYPLKFHGHLSPFCGDVSSIRRSARPQVNFKQFGLRQRKITAITPVSPTACPSAAERVSVDSLHR